jgi:hypothetical protein
MNSLRRLVLTFREDELLVHALYRAGDMSASPNTKKRLRCTTELVREGLQYALDALDSEAGSPACVGTSGFTQREDVLSIDTMPKGA